MTNSYRNPKPGTNATSRRIAKAVDDEEWQKFRVSLKGQSTTTKLRRLKRYYEDGIGEADVEIRVDNYLKALARGGQIHVVELGDYVDCLLMDVLRIKRD